MTLCDHCQRADTTCPIYPQTLSLCAEFLVHEHAREDAALVVAGGLRASKNLSQRERDHFALLCKLLGAP